MRSLSLLAALMSVGVIFCACRPSSSSPPTPTDQSIRHRPVPDTGHQPTAPESPSTDDHSTTMMASLAVAGGMLILQQGERTETRLGEGFESNPTPFLKLQTM